jgi:hypothetical protein
MGTDFKDKPWNGTQVSENLAAIRYITITTLRRDETTDITTAAISLSKYRQNTTKKPRPKQIADII